MGAFGASGDRYRHRAAAAASSRPADQNQPPARRLRETMLRDLASAQGRMWVLEALSTADGPLR
jgi:hypothetical protein